MPGSKPAASRAASRRGARMSMSARCAATARPSACWPTTTGRRSWTGRSRRSSPDMRVVLFCHSLLSDWNHGNAHFLRGVAGELIARGHEVIAYEPHNGWSVTQLLAEAGAVAVDRFRELFPRLDTRMVDLERLDLDEALDGADLVIVHEWNTPALVTRIGEHRTARGRYTLLFHDTHHRSVTDADAIAACALDHYDGVLAFG